MTVGPPSVLSPVSASGHPELTLIPADNDTDLFVWDIAEATVTLMAACIPTLRVFLREKTSSGGPSNERSTRVSQFSLSFRSANRGRLVFDSQAIEPIREQSVEKGEIFTGSGTSRDGSAAGSGGGNGSGSGGPTAAENSV
jgi:hypothetical protein